MRVVTNRRYVRTRARFGRLATLGGFGALIGGLAYSTFGIGAQDTSTIVVSYVALIAGYLLITIGKGPWMRFAISPRPDEILVNNLRTLDARTLLFNYVSAFEPVQHLIATPNGLVVVETRPFVGVVEVRGDRWRRRRGLFGWLQFMSEGAIGNPTRDALASTEAMKHFLTERLGPEMAERIPVEPLVVFTHPRVQLLVEEPTVPVVHARDARTEVRRLTSGPKLPTDVQRRLDQLLLDETRLEGEPVSAGEAIEKRTRGRRKAARAK